MARSLEHRLPLGDALDGNEQGRPKVELRDGVPRADSGRWRSSESDGAHLQAFSIAASKARDIQCFCWEMGTRTQLLDGFFLPLGFQVSAPAIEYA